MSFALPEKTRSERAKKRLKTIGKAHKKYGFYLKMSMIPKSRDNRIAVIEAHHSNPMTAIHIPMLTQIQRI